MKNKNALNRTMRFENMEDRSMLSVSAILSGETLNIDGTPANDSVQIYEKGTTWKVQGIGGTKVNNSTSPQSFVGVDTINADLGPGTDRIHVFNGTLPGLLNVVWDSASPGFKTTQLNNLKLDSLSVTDETNGANVIVANNIQTTDIAEFSTGDGNQTIILSNLKIGTNLEIRAGNGNNGNDVISLHKVFAINIDVATGNGNDSISLTHVSTITFGNIEIESGDGTDAVTLDTVTTGDLGVGIGPGNFDTAVVVNATVNSNPVFNDDGGTNGTLIGSHNHFANPPIFIGDFAHVIGI